MLPYASLADTDRQFQKCSAVRGVANRRRVRHAQRASARQAARKEINVALQVMADDELERMLAERIEQDERELEHEFYDFATGTYYGRNSDHELVWFTGCKMFGPYTVDTYSDGSMMYGIYRIVPVEINDEVMYEALEGDTYLDWFESVEACCAYLYPSDERKRSFEPVKETDFMTATGYSYVDEVYTLW